MNALVIGGTKYFGKLLVRKLLARGDRVTLFTRGSTRPEFWDDVETILGDRKEHAAFEAALAGREFDAVIDQQAYTREDQESAVRAFEGRVGRYVLTSTVSVYFDGYIDFERQAPQREDDLKLDEIGWDYPEGHDPYAVGKRHCEKVLLGRPGFPWSIVRVPPVMGPEDWTGRFWTLHQRVLDGDPMALPDGGLNVFRNIYSDDLAQAFVDLVDTPGAVNRTYNVAQRELMTHRLFVEKIAAAAGRQPELVPVPRALLDRAGCRTIFARPGFHVMDTARAECDFGLRTTPVDDWIKTTVDWYLAHPPGTDSAGYDRRAAEIELCRWCRDRQAALEADGLAFAGGLTGSR